MKQSKLCKRAYQLGFAYGMGFNLGMFALQAQGYDLTIDAAGKWITTGGEDDETGAKHMYINPYSGKVLKGPKAMQGKTLKEGFKDLKELHKKQLAKEQAAKSQAKPLTPPKQSNTPQQGAGAQNGKVKAIPHASKPLTPAQVAAIIYKGKGAYTGHYKPKQSKKIGETNANAFHTLEEAKAALDNKDYAKIYNSLSESERDAVMNYSGSDYREINKSLRNYQKGDELSGTVKELTKALDKARLSSDAVLHRGCSAAELQSYLDMPLFSVSDMDNTALQSCVNRTFSVKQFLSTSALSHGAFEGDVRLTINAPKGSKALWMGPTKNGDPLSCYSSEYEVLFQRGTSFSISKISRENGKINVELMALKKAPKLVENAK